MTKVNILCKLMPNSMDAFFVKRSGPKDQDYVKKVGIV